MEFLGVGPAELIFVLVIALVVVGPERLPVLARQAGKFLVTVRNWVQKSPDAAMVLRARQEIETELANIRESLAEVQNARDEVVQAAKQVNTLVKDDVIGQTRAAIEEVTQPGSIARSTKPNGLPAQTSAPPESSAAQAAADLPSEPKLVAPDGTTLIEAEPPPSDETATIAPPRADAQPATSSAGTVALEAQIAALAEELRQLQAQLQERGVLDPAPLVGTYAPPPSNLRVPDLPARDYTPEPTTLEEPVDVDQPAYNRD